MGKVDVFVLLTLFVFLFATLFGCGSTSAPKVLPFDYGEQKANDPVQYPTGVSLSEAIAPEGCLEPSAPARFAAPAPSSFGLKPAAVAAEPAIDEPIDLFAEGGALGKGSSEISLYTSANWKTISPDEGDDIDVNVMVAALSYGYYAAEGLSLGASLTGFRMGIEDSTFHMFLLAFTPRYHFNVESDKVVPYVGVDLGGTFGLLETEGEEGDEDEETTMTGFSFGAVAGIKFFPGKNYSIFAELKWLGTSGTWKNDYDGDLSLSDLYINLGLNIYF